MDSLKKQVCVEHEGNIVYLFINASFKIQSAVPSLMSFLNKYL